MPYQPDTRYWPERPRSTVHWGDVAKCTVAFLIIIVLIAL